MSTNKITLDASPVISQEWKALDTHPICNLDKIASADPATPISLVEGEKCAGALTDLGYLTTTTFGGATAGENPTSNLSGTGTYMYGLSVSCPTPQWLR
jgi:hypothetical protein